MSDPTLELHKQHQASQDKYTYFLLAASGACIAFASEKALGVPLTCPLLFLAAAVLSWSFSFYCGCKSANTVQAIIGANANLIWLKSGTHPKQPNTQEGIAAAIRGVESAIETNMGRANSFSKWQFNSFVSGGVFFVVWRITEIVRLAPQP